MEHERLDPLLPELLRAALDATGDALLVTDPQRLEFLLANEAAQKLFGAPEADLLAAGPARLLATDPDALRREYEELIASGKPRAVVREARLPGRPGHALRLEFQRQARQVDGRWVVITRVRDQTELEALRAARREGVERLARLLEQVPGALFQYRVEAGGAARFTWVNEGLQDMLGVLPEEALADARAAFRHVAQPDLLRLQARMRECAKRQAPLRMDLQLLLPGQEPRWRTLRANPQALPAGAVLWHGFIADVTPQRLALAQLAAERDRLGHLLRHVPASIALMDLDGTVRLANGGPLREHCGDGGPQVGQALTACACWQEDAQVRHALAAALLEARSGKPARFELRLEGPLGRPAPFDVSLVPLADPQGRPREILLCAVATGAHEEADHNSSLFARLFELSNDGIVITDDQARIVAVNQAFTAMTGFTLEEVLGSSPRVLSSGQNSPETYQEMWHALQREGFWRGEVMDKRKDGSTFPKAMTVSAIRDRQGRTVNYVANFSDLSRDREAEARLLYLARHDTLTGLANRARLAERLEQVLWQATQRHEKFAVVFVDLDQLKDLNDTLGHSAGDALIQEVARRLAGCVRQEDVVARFGGDEFVLVVSDLPGPGALDQIGRRILRAVQAPMEVGGRLIQPGCSIGIAVFPDDGTDRETLLMNADVAMYHAKTSGRNNHQFYNAGLREAAAQRLRFDTELRQALEGNQFVLHYQPQVDPQGRLRGFEALLRWQHPQDGLVAPLRFIPHLEQSGLIREVGTWALHEACHQLRLWREKGFEGSVAVNVAERQLRSGDLVDAVRVALDNHGLPAQCLEIEITESAALHEPQRAREVLGDLRALGVRVALDDFGTGYSSLGQLRTLPIDCVKLDRSFQPASAHDANAAICRAAVAMAHALGLQVVAEGVETPLQQAILCDLGVDLMQGYLFGRPAPAGKLDLGQRFGVASVR